MENEVVFEARKDGYLCKFKVLRGNDGLLVSYKLNVDYFGNTEPKWLIEKKFYNYDYNFFRAMESASLYLNAYEAASKMGLYEEMKAFRMLVESEAIGNAFRAGELVSSNPFMYNETPQSFINATKKYVKYI